jgi:MFS family permease
MTPLARPFELLRSATAGLPRAFWALWAGTLITRIGNFVIPFLALYLTGERGFSVEQATGIVTLHGLGGAIASLVGGTLADRIGRRTTMLLGLVPGAFLMLTLGLVHHPGAVAVTAFFLGLTAESYRPASQAMIADIIPPKDRLRAFTLQYWAFNLGFAIATALAGLIAQRNFLALFIGDAITTLLFAGLIFFTLPETRPDTPAGTRSAELRGLAAPFVDPVFLPYFLLSMALCVIFLQCHTALPISMRADGIPPDRYGLLIGFNGVMIIVLQPFLARWVGTLRRARVLAVAALLVGGGFGLTGLASTWQLYLLSIVIWTFGEIIMMPVNSTIVADLAPAHLRGRYQGAFALSWAGAQSFGPILGGLVMGRLGAGYLWGGCALVGAVIAGLHLVIAGPRRRRVQALLGAEAVHAD